MTLHEYKHWRKRLTPLNNQIMINWNVAYSGTTMSDNIKSGQYFKIINCREPLFGKIECAADLIYDLISCSKNGKTFKKQFSFSVEFIAKKIENGEVSIVGNERG